MAGQIQSTSRVWRIVQFPLVRIVLAFVWLITIVTATQLSVGLLPVGETFLAAVLSAVVVAAVAFLAYYAFVRGIEKRPVSELAIQGAAAELATGILIGAGLFSVTIGILWALGIYRVTGLNDWTVAVPVFAVSVISGVFEEILFRGVLFRIVEESLGTWISLLISALIFGFLHLANPNANLVAGAAIALEAGVLLAAAYLLTRRLWLAIGLHFAWNFTQGGVFGVAVSGVQFGGLLQPVLTGPDILSGGEFGAEASIVAVLVCTAAGLYLLWKAQKKGNFVKPFWKGG